MYNSSALVTHKVLLEILVDEFGIVVSLIGLVVVFSLSREVVGSVFKSSFISVEEKIF